MVFLLFPLFGVPWAAVISSLSVHLVGVAALSVQYGVEEDSPPWFWQVTTGLVMQLTIVCIDYVMACVEHHSRSGLRREISSPHPTLGPKAKAKNVIPDLPGLGKILPDIFENLNLLIFADQLVHIQKCLTET